MCGIFGIVSNNNDIVWKIALGLYDLQHRGEQGAGIVTFDGKNIQERKKKGLVTEVFCFNDEEKQKEIFQNLSGLAGIGHTLYSTIGKGKEKKQPQTFQPLIGNFDGQPFALAHNGNLIELEELKKEAKEKGYNFQSETSDTEVIVALLSTTSEKTFLGALQKTLPRLKGAFALTMLYQDKVIGVRDKYGIRPLCLGRDKSSFMLASESCAFYSQGANYIRDIQPGEILVLGQNGIEDSLIWPAEKPDLRFCIFEYIYFARPDSKLNGQSVYFYRERAGALLAKEHAVRADIVIPVPESGRIYDTAFAEVSGIPLKEGLFRNRYFSGKTFLTPRQTDRSDLQRRKMHPLRKVVHNKSVVVIEDSIIRANVSPEIVAMLREAGTKEVHLRVGSSPIRYPCFLGIDIPTKGELVAANLTPDEIGRRIIQTDSLGYLSLQGMIDASGLAKKNLCLGCFTGEYPL